MNKENLTVDAAAIMDLRDKKVYSVPRPGRHNDVMALMYESGIPKIITGQHEQGFLLSNGMFVGRIPAKRIAKKAGQLLPRASDLRQLFSEDVW